MSTAPRKQKPVRLRGHHLLCILNYGGAGYTPAFIQNMSAMIDRMNGGASIEIVRGIDDICGALRCGGVATCDHARMCRCGKTFERDRRALTDIARVLRLPGFGIGRSLRLGRRQVAILRRFFARNGIRKACVKCPWHARCTSRAAGKFIGARLFPV